VGRVEAARPTTGVLYQRVRGRRGMQIAVVATARKIATLCWQLATHGTQYAYTQPSLVAHQHRQLELRAGHPATRGRRGTACGYSLKAVRDAERRLAEQAELAYKPSPPPGNPDRLHPPGRQARHRGKHDLRHPTY
jgi:hypothetical protein